MTGNRSGRPGSRQPEDIEGQTRVARGIAVPLALCETRRTVCEYRPRLEVRACGIVQPEMDHTGITQFARLARMAEAFHLNVIPHAFISCGLFMAASLQATAALSRVPYHEYQHSIFDRNLAVRTRLSWALRATPTIWPAEPAQALSSDGSATG